MVDINEVKKVYLIGIGGIGMSALARYFKFHGKEVSGYDKTSTVLTQQLESEDIPVHYEENMAKAPLDADLVIYTPAVPNTHRELVFYRDKDYAVLKRSEVLGAITNSSFNICVAGTHGKTTITTMIAHLLRHTEYGCNAFLGGIAENYNSNFWTHERSVCVIEADEYDRSFLMLSPDVAVISYMDPDHLDIYGTPEAMQEAYLQFAGKVKPGGLLVSKWGLPIENRYMEAGHITYSLDNENADVYGINIKTQHGSYWFDVKMNDWLLEGVQLNMGGMHNVENMIAAIAIAHHLGIEDERIKAAVSDFKGIRRRFTYIIKEEQLVFIDDYAHHPEELKALIKGAKGLFPEMQSTLVFQPHLFSRTRDFANEFAAVLEQVNEVILLPIYPARELPIENVTSEMLLERMNAGNGKVMQKEEMLAYLQQLIQKKTNAGRLIIFAGAGDIDALVQPAKSILKTT